MNTFLRYSRENLHTGRAPLAPPRRKARASVFTAGLALLIGTSGLIQGGVAVARSDIPTGLFGALSNANPDGIVGEPFMNQLLRTYLMKPHRLERVDSAGTPLAAAVASDNDTRLRWPGNQDGDESVALSDPGGIPVNEKSGEWFTTRTANEARITHKVRARPQLSIGEYGDEGVMSREPGDGAYSYSVLGTGGPIEGRPPGEAYAHQRWPELIDQTPQLPPVGYVVSHGQIIDGFRFSGLVDSLVALIAGDPAPAHSWTIQKPDAVWTFGEGRFVRGANWVTRDLPRLIPEFPAIIQARYGETIVLRNYNNLPLNPAHNGASSEDPAGQGFGRNEPTTHNHNGHNGAETDAGGFAHFYPGQYYDYLWSTILARRDAGMKMSDGRDLDEELKVSRPDANGGNARASTPTDDGGILPVPGDFREIQGTLWFHDHRIAYTSENVYKGFAALLAYYSGPDRGYERGDLAQDVANQVSLRYPSGWRNGKTWGNRDFDEYLVIQDSAFTNDGQLYFDINDTDGFLGDVMHINYQRKPTMNVLPRKYRFRTLSAGMSRWIQLALVSCNDGQDLSACMADPNRKIQNIPVTQIANDGNVFPEPITLTTLDQQATAERYDIIVDFSMGTGDLSTDRKYYLVNLIEFSNGRGPDKTLTVEDALSGESDDPGVGAVMAFKVVGSVPSVDDPDGPPNTIDNEYGSDGDLIGVGACGKHDKSRVIAPNDLVVTATAPGIRADREGHPEDRDWQIPVITPVRTRTIEFVRDETPDSGLPFDHPPGPEPWGIEVETDAGEGEAHQTEMRRSMSVAQPGDVEHWTFKSSGGWGHPVHIHFEEPVVVSRDGDIHPTEARKRKDMFHIGGLVDRVEGDGAPIGGDFGDNIGSDITVQVVFSEFGGAYVNHCHNTVHEDNAMLLRYDIVRGDSTTSGVDDMHVSVLPTPDPRVTGVSYTPSCYVPEANPTSAQAGIPLCPTGIIGPVEGGQKYPGEEGYVVVPHCPLDAHGKPICSDSTSGAGGLSDLDDNPKPQPDFDGNAIANSSDSAERLPPPGPIGRVTEHADPSKKKKRGGRGRRGSRKGIETEDDESLKTKRGETGRRGIPKGIVTEDDESSKKKKRRGKKRGGRRGHGRGRGLSKL